ncbi:MAG TPA: hypothetical protein VMG36_02840 [Thermoplasmata archaeon]|nr:hypothetical protein [Thermoplasmata archaeon]
MTAVAVGALVALASIAVLNGGPLLVPKAQPPGTVVLDGIEVDYFYVNGTPDLFGANQQQVCVNCPLVLTGGTTFTIGTLFQQEFPANATTTFLFNATSVIPLEEWECSYSGSRPTNWPPTGCPFTTDWHQGSFFVDDDAGGSLIIGYPITFQIPSPAPNLPGGFLPQLVFTVVGYAPG